MCSKNILQLLKLPDQVPHLGFNEPNFIGSGIIGCGGDAEGVWNYLIGPSYSAPSFIKKENVKVIINGKQHHLNSPMHRAKGTGIFYSTNKTNDAIVYLVDFAIIGTPIMVRLIATENISHDTLELRSCVELKHSKPSKISFHVNEGTEIDIVDNKVFHMVQLKENHVSVALCNDYPEIINYEDETLFKSESKTLKKNESAVFAIYHYAHRDDISPLAVKALIDRRSPVTDLHHAIEEWFLWMKAGKDLALIQDQVARDIVESTTIITRMQQGVDGGIMATPRTYPLSFMRDNHSAVRGMLATGHMEEAKRYLNYVNQLYRIQITKGKFGVVNFGSIGGKTLSGGYHGDEYNKACEVTSMCVLTVKRYFEVTKDLETVKSLDELLRYATDAQLEIAKKHNWKLFFNGDETESSGCGMTLKEKKPTGTQYHSYSMPSLVMLIASLEFMIEYLNLIGDTKKAEEYQIALEPLNNSLENNFWDEEAKIFHWFQDLDGKMPTTRVTNYHIMPLYFDTYTIDNTKAKQSAISMNQFLGIEGFIPNQPLGEKDDFVGHNLGYMLFALTKLGSPLKERVYHSLLKTVGQWGMWAETYFSDGRPYDNNETRDSRIHNLRPFESGTNIEAIIYYWNEKIEVPRVQ